MTLQSTSRSTTGQQLCSLLDWISGKLIGRLYSNRFGIVVIFAPLLISSGIIIFRLLGEAVDSSVTLVPGLRGPLDFCALQCTLDRHSGSFCRVIPFFTGSCSAEDIFVLIVVVAREFVNSKDMTHDSTCPYSVRNPVWFSLPSLSAMMW